MAQKLRLGVHADHFGVQLAHKHVHYHVALVQAQQAVVHKHAGQLVANGAVDQRCRHAGIHAAAQAQDHVFLAHLLFDQGYRLGDVVFHHPIGPGLANLQHKTLQNRLALQGVRDFGVELQGVKIAFFVGHARNGATAGAGHPLEAGRHLDHVVAMAHPNL